MGIGIIKFFNTGKGFGFVTPDAGGADIFLPGSSVTTSGLVNIQPGQRVSFEQVPDARGPKVVSLKLIGEAPVKPVIAVLAKERVTVYCDGTSDAAADVLDALQSGGYQFTLHNYIAAPPSIDQLRRISHQLSEGGQSLVRRYNSLFLALQLDDRFISEQDFWTAIVEHPALINGPVLVRSGKAYICKTAEEVRAYLSRGNADVQPTTKTLSPRIAAMLKDNAVGASLSPAPAAAVQKATPRAPASFALSKAAAKQEPQGTAKLRRKTKAAKKPVAVKTAKKSPASKRPGKPAKKKSKK